MSHGACCAGVVDSASTRENKKIYNKYLMGTAVYKDPQYTLCSRRNRWPPNLLTNKNSCSSISPNYNDFVGGDVNVVAHRGGLMTMHIHLYSLSVCYSGGN